MTPIENLSPNNFLIVCDLAMDIKEKLQMSTTNVMTLPLLRQPYIPHGQIFNTLIPSKDPGSINSYCSRRIEALGYLKESGALESFELPNNEFYPVPLMDSAIDMIINNEGFDRFYIGLEKAYQIRVVDPAIKEQEKIKSAPSYTSELHTEIESSNNKFPHKLPSGTKWENFVITFTDDEAVCISVRGINHKANFKDLGFQDKRNSKPNNQWHLLKLLAKLGGEVSWKSSEADVKFKKYKERLTEALQYYFSLEFDPFWPYQDSRSYKTKFTLILPQTNEPTAPRPILPRNAIHDEVEEFFAGLIVEE
jgi:hypothetical protein